MICPTRLSEVKIGKVYNSGCRDNRGENSQNRDTMATLPVPTVCASAAASPR